MDNEKTKSVIAYIFGIISGVIILVMKETEQKTSIHAAQSITICLSYYILNIGYKFIPFGIPFFNYALTGIYFVAIIYGIVKACKDEEPELPVIGDLAKNIFKKQIEG